MATDLAEIDFAAEISPWVTWANSLAITTDADFTDAAEQLKGIKSLQKEIEASYGPLKQKASEAHKAIVAEEKRQLAPLVKAEAVCKSLMLTYQQAEQRKAEGQRRRLQAEADEKARREREALEKKAAAAKKPETQQKYQEQAAQVMAPVVAVAPSVPKVSGISTKKIWKARIVDEAKIPRAYLMVDTVKLDRYARAMGSQASVEGVVFYQEDSMAAGGR